MTYSNSFFHNLFKGDNFPKDYFMFLLKVMQIFKALKAISQLKIEFIKVGSPQPIAAPSNFELVSFKMNFSIFYFFKSMFKTLFKCKLKKKSYFFLSN
jgi:hypothetical protein